MGSRRRAFSRGRVVDGNFSEFAKVTRRRKRRRRYRWAVVAFTLGFSLGALVTLTTTQRLADLRASSEKAIHADGSS